MTTDGDLHLRAQQACLEVRRRGSAGYSVIPEDYADSVMDLVEPILVKVRTALVLGWDGFEGDAQQARDEAWAAIQNTICP